MSSRGSAPAETSSPCSNPLGSCSVLSGAGTLGGPLPHLGGALAGRIQLFQHPHQPQGPRCRQEAQKHPQLHQRLRPALPMLRLRAAAAGSRPAWMRRQRRQATLPRAPAAGPAVCVPLRSPDSIGHGRRRPLGNSPWRAGAIDAVGLNCVHHPGPPGAAGCRAPPPRRARAAPPSGPPPRSCGRPGSARCADPCCRSTR